MLLNPHLLKHTLTVQKHNIKNNLKNVIKIIKSIMPISADTYILCIPLCILVPPRYYFY